MKISQNSQGKPSYYQHIDGLRAVAVLLVVFYHFNLFSLTGGFIGVDVFLVISGFLITAVIMKDIRTNHRLDCVAFFTRRAFRLLPAFIVTMIFVIFFSIALINTGEMSKISSSLNASLTFLSNIYYSFFSGYQDDFSQLNPVLNTWTLSLEWQFYLLFPILLILLLKVTTRIKWIVLIIIMTMLVSFFLNILHADYPDYLYYQIQYRLFEFLIGAVVFFIKDCFNDVSQHLKEIMTCLGFALILSSAFLFDHDTVFPGFYTWLPCLGASFIILFAKTTVSGAFLKNKAIVYIGLISYSLYLVHWPIFVFAKRLSFQITQTDDLSLFSIAIVLFFSIAVASVLYHFVECTFRRKTPVIRQQQVYALLHWFLMILFFIYISFFIGTGFFNQWRSDQVNHDAYLFHKKTWGGQGAEEGFIGKLDDHSPAQLIMLGDSQTFHLSYGITKLISQPNQVATYLAAGGGGKAYESCLPLPGLSRVKELKRRSSVFWDQHCQMIYQDALTQVKKNKEATLLLAMSLEGLKRSGYIQTHQALNINLLSSHDQDYQALLLALDRLRHDVGDRKIILFGVLPGSQSYSPVQCFGQLKWFSNHCRQLDSITGKIEKINLNRVLKNYANKHDNIFFLDPFDAFCNQMTCYNYFSKNHAFYSDHKKCQHLSKFGSYYLINYFKLSLETILSTAHNQK